MTTTAAKSICTGQRKPRSKTQAAKFSSFSRKRLEFWLIQLRNHKGSEERPNHLLGWSECGGDIENRFTDSKINEFTYRFKTKNKSASLIIFSTIDRDTELCTKKGSGCVRVLWSWTTKYGERFKHIADLKRTGKLEESLRVLLLSEARQCFGMSTEGWSKNLDEVVPVGVKS